MRLYRIRLLSRVHGTGGRGLGGPSSSGTGDDSASETLVRYCARDVACCHHLPATGRRAPAPWLTVRGHSAVAASVLSSVRSTAEETGRNQARRSLTATGTFMF